MRKKESLRSNPYIFYQPEKREKVNGLKSFMAFLLLRSAAFMMCPGDDISMVLAAGNTHQPNMPEAAILFEDPRVNKKEKVILRRI